MREVYEEKGGGGGKSLGPLGGSRGDREVRQRLGMQKRRETQVQTALTWGRGVACSGPGTAGALAPAPGSGFKEL